MNSDDPIAFFITGPSTALTSREIDAVGDGAEKAINCLSRDWNSGIRST